MKNEVSQNEWPGDIRRVMAHRRRVSVLLSLLWYAVWGVSIMLYYVRHPDASPRFTLAILAVVLLVLPLWFFSLRTVLFDRCWSGEIVKIKYRMMSDIPMLSEGLERVERHEVAVLYVRRRTDGKVKKLSCRRLWRSADRCYRTGDTVRHLPFVGLPQNLSHEPETGKLCLVCGTLSENSTTTCIECQHTIL